MTFKPNKELKQTGNNANGPVGKNLCHAVTFCVGAILSVATIASWS